MAETTAERYRKEEAARDAHMKAHKDQADRQGREVTHEQIQKHVDGIADKVRREKDHSIYKD